MCPQLWKERQVQAEKKACYNHSSSTQLAQQKHRGLFGPCLENGNFYLFVLFLMHCAKRSLVLAVANIRHLSRPLTGLNCHSSAE